MTTQDKVPVQSLYATFQGILNLYVTNQCNIQCRHCATGSGPKEKTALKLHDTLADEVIDAIRRGRVRALHVSGGEPFLRRHELSLLSAIALAEGVLLAVNTNGFWASTVRHGMDVLEELPGVTQILLSTDVYHAEFLALERVVNAAAAALECGRLVDVATVTPLGQRDSFTDHLDALLESAGVLSRVRRLFSTLGPTARDVPLDERDLPPWRLGPASGPCNQLNRPTILEDRTVLACCNTTIAAQCANSPLILGHVGEAPLPEVLARAANDPLLKAVRALGPTFLSQILASDGQEVFRERYRDGDMCTLCADIMSEPRMVALLRERISSGSTSRLVDAALSLRCGIWPVSPDVGG